MMQATSPSDTAAARASVTAAASNAAAAELVGALFDVIYALRRDHGEPSATMPVLVRLSVTGPVRAAELADALHLDQSTVSRHVCTLEGDGLVARDTDPADGRAQLVRLTPSGEAAVAVMVADRVGRFEAAISGWPENDVETLARLLHSFIDGLTAQDRNPE